MSPDLEKVVAEALELPRSQQTGFLEYACAGRAELRAEAESLLAVRVHAEHFLERPAGPPAALPVTDGRRMGPYRLVREIGKGGMSTVYLAERDDRHFERRVAVKIIAGVRHSVEAERRFRSEWQILAALEHPNIARLLDTGITSDGVAYLVMEYIEGQPLLEYCSALPLAQRVELFRGVCAAVGVAHQHLIVHRDIKPANVLVTAEGVPKLLDFGIAKILATSPGAADGAEDGAENCLTMAHAHPMTPDYASPEQIRGAAISTASDIYALGSLLYELLAGQRPFQLAGMTFEDAMRAVCEREPASLLTIRPQTPPDLEAIVQKAMRKAPKERYASAQELSADVGRYLEGRPVLAQRRSAGYVLRKFVKRHRVACAATALGLVFAGGMITVTVRQGQVAQRRFDDVRKLAHSLMYELNDGLAALPGSEDMRKLLVTRVLDSLGPLAKEADGDFALQLELADAYTRIGSIQGSPNVPNLGDSAGALASYGKARRLLESVLSRRPSDIPGQTQLARLQSQIAAVHLYLRQEAQALREAEAGLQAWQQVARARPQDDSVRGAIAQAYFQMGDSVFRQNPGQSVEYLRKALAIEEQLLAAHPGDAEMQHGVTVILRKLASTLFEKMGDARTAREYYLRALDLDTSRSQTAPKASLAALDVSFDLSELGHIAEMQRDLDQALSFFERALDIRKRLVALDPRNARLSNWVPQALLRVGAIRYQKGQSAEALPSLREAQSAAAALVAANPNDNMNRGTLVESWMGIGGVEELLARPREACTALRRSLEAFDELQRRAAVSNYEKSMAERARDGVARNCK